MNKIFRLFLFVFGLSGVICWCQGAKKTQEPVDVSISAHFDPDEIGIDQGVRYIIEVTNAFPSSFQLPAIPGLRKIGEQTYQSATSINGKFSQKTSLIFTFIPEKTGTISVPSFEITVAGESCIVPSSTLKVVEAPQKHIDDTNAQGGSKMIATLKPSEQDNVYVGQKIPSELSLILDNDLDLINNVTVKNLSKDVVSSSLSEQPYAQPYGPHKNLFSWKLYLTPIKEGLLEPQFEVNCPLHVVRTIGFFSVAEQIQEQLKTVSCSLIVHSLPEAPSSFTGGIGEFTLKTQKISSERALLGEPLTFSIEISGTGNFERLQAPTLKSDENWKCLAPETFYKGNEIEGTKTFKYVLIPQKTGEIEVPEVVFSYFSPKDQQYHKLRNDSKLLKVIVSRSTEAPLWASLETTQSTTKDDASKIAQDLAILTEDTIHYTTLRPWILEKKIWIIHWSLAALILCLYLLNLLRNRQTKRSPKKHRMNLEKERQRLLKILESGDLIACYKSAEEITQVEFSRKLGGYLDQKKAILWLQKQSVEEAHWLEKFYSEADDVIFGHKKLLKLYVTQQIDHLFQILKNIKKS